MLPSFPSILRPQIDKSYSHIGQLGERSYWKCMLECIRNNFRHFAMIIKIQLHLFASINFNQAQLCSQSKAHTHTHTRRLTIDRKCFTQRRICSHLKCVGVWVSVLVGCACGAVLSSGYYR